MRDVILALVNILKRDPDLDELVKGRIYGDEIPPGEPRNMPRPAVVVRHTTGGVPPGGFVELHDQPIDLVAFGETPLRAEAVRELADEVLKYIQREVNEETLIHSVVMTASPDFGRDSDTFWPFSRTSWRCLASEKQAT